MELKDWLNSINFTKEDLSYDVKTYPPYVINRCLSGFIDTIMYANEMNRYHNLDKDMQYSFYLNSVRKRKRNFTRAVIYYISRVDTILYTLKNYLH